MDNNITPDTLISYLDNELEPDERLYVEARLAADPALGLQLQRLALARQAAAHYGTRQRVAEIHREMMQEMRAKPRARVLRVRWLLRVAAVLLVMLLVAGVVQHWLLDENRLYNARYERYAMSITRDDDTAISRIAQLYGAGNLQEAASAYEDQSQAPLPSDHFLAAQAYLSMNETGKAILALEAQLRANGSLGSFKPYHDDAEYYLALAYLKDGRLAQAIPLFRHIHDTPAHAYHRQVSSWYLWRLQWLQWKKS